MSGSVNEELLALIFFSQYYFLIEGIFCPERSTKYKKNLAQQFTTLLFLQHGNDGIYGVKHQLASEVANSLYSLPSAHSCEPKGECGIRSGITWGHGQCPVKN